MKLFEGFANMQKGFDLLSKKERDELFYVAGKIIRRLVFIALGLSILSILTM